MTPKSQTLSGKLIYEEILRERAVKGDQGEELFLMTNSETQNCLFGADFFCKGFSHRLKIIS
jgi:hypothetical protein